MPIEVKHGLQRSSPEQQGIPSGAIVQFVEAVERQIHEFHSFMLLRHGHVVAEGWWSPYRRASPHTLYSLSKCFTSTAIGLAVSEGRLTIDDAVVSFFPDETPAKVSDHLAAMRVRDLLAMASGHAADTIAPMVKRPDGNWIKGFFEVPVVHRPGTHFVYNSGATYMLTAIVQQVTGLKMVDYLTPRLFEPLGIENVVWSESPQGVNTGGWLKTEDIARFGQLYLQKGQWADRHILPEAWVEAATSRQMATGEDATSDRTQGYGYQFWRCRHGAYQGTGAFGQYCIVMPEQDAVLAITGGMNDTQAPLNLIWEMLLPAMGANALPDDTEAYDHLTQKLASLAVPSVPGNSSSPRAASLSNRCYHAEENARKIETLALKFTESGCIARFKTAAREETISCGYGVWYEGQTVLFKIGWDADPTPIVASGAWTNDDTFTLVIRMYETPFYETLVFHFAEDQVRIETLANVGFATPKTQRIVARAQPII